MSADATTLLRRGAELHQRHLTQVRQVRSDDPKARRDIRILTDEMRTATDLSAEIPSMLYTVGRLAADPTLVPPALLAEYLETVVRATANLGTGADRSVARTAIKAAIDRFRTEGFSASELYLSYQRFLSYITLESREREHAIQAAITDADNHDTEFRATYALAWYLVEISKYRQALKVCEQAVRHSRGHPDQELWELSFLSLEGVARYTTLNNPDRVYTLLREVLARFEGKPRFRDADVAYSEALHYLGRCELDRANAAEALRLFIRSQEVKQQHPFESRATAYYHIRMAEALIGVRNLTQANEHLTAASEFLNRVGDTSAGRVLYDFAMANFLIEKGDAESAIELLDQAARAAKRERFARGHLLALGRLFTIRWSRRQLIAASIVLFRAVPILFSGELRRNSALAISANLKRYALAVLRPYQGQAAKALQFEECPCDLHG